MEEVQAGEVIRNALDNYCHGREAFALSQLEAFIGVPPAASVIADWNKKRLTRYWMLEMKWIKR